MFAAHHRKDRDVIVPESIDTTRQRLQAAVGADFEVRERLGRGAFADVFEAFDPRLERTVALKVLRDDLPLSTEQHGRFRREAANIAAVRHPNILPIHTIDERDGITWLVIDHVAGETLEQYLERVPLPPLDEVTRILRDAASGLAAAHRAGIVHRDIKPDNIMLEGDERRVLLMDFGVARAIGRNDESLTRAGEVIGTPHYMSPEQAAGDSSDHRADLYALGIIGYRLISGRLPFDAPGMAAVLLQHLTRTPEPLEAKRPDCPRWLSLIIERCLAKSPDERWQSAAELIEALDLRESAAPGTTRPAAGDSSSVAADFRRRVSIVVASTIAAALLDGVVWRAPLLSPFVLLAAVFILAADYGRLWTLGYGWGTLWRRRIDPTGSEADDFGRHAGLMAQARLYRTNIVRALSGLSRQEQGVTRGCVPAADALLARCAQLVRRIRALDERIGAERGARLAGAAAGVRASGPIDELYASRAEFESSLRHAIELLSKLRHLVSLAAETGTDDVARELTRCIAAAERCIRGEPSIQRT